MGVATAGAVSAGAGTTEPTDTAAAGTAPADTASAETAAAGSVAAAGDPSAFCEAELAVEAAFSSGDPEAIGPAVEALTAATPEELADVVPEVLANAETAGPGSPEFDEPYGQMIEYVQANCGFAELDVAASEYSFGGIPEEVPAGPTIINLENIGEEVHEIIIVRVNDGVDLTAEELLALPEEEAFASVTEVGGTFAMPGGIGHTVVDLQPGRHLALCFIPEGTTPEVLEQMMAAEGSMPEGSMPEGSMPMESMAPDGSMAPMDSMAPDASMAPDGTAAEGLMSPEAAATTEPAATEASVAAAGSVAPDASMAPGSSTPAEGSAPPGEGPPHAMLGMVQEFTVV